MLDTFRTFQATEIFVLEMFRAGHIDAEGFRKRMAQLGFTPAETQAELRHHLKLETKEIMSL